MDGCAASIGERHRNHHKQHACGEVNEERVCVAAHHIPDCSFHDHAAEKGDGRIERMAAPEQREKRRHTPVAEVADPGRVSGSADDRAQLLRGCFYLRHIPAHAAAKGVQAVQLVQIVGRAFDAHGFCVVALSVMDAYDDAGGHGKYLRVRVSVCREHAGSGFFHAVDLRAVADELPPYFAAEVQAQLHMFRMHGLVSFHGIN